MSLVDEKDFEMRYFEKGDGKQLGQWLALDSIKPYFPSTTKEEIENTVRIWQAYSRYHCGLTALYKKKAVGMGILYLMPYRKVAHHALLYAVVNPELENKGIGASLVRNLTHLGKKYFSLEAIYCELYEGSPLKADLEKEGYCVAFEQKRFVEDSRSRIMMEKKL